MTKKVVVLDSISPEGLALLDAAKGIEYEVRTGLSGPELRAALAEFDGAICRSGVTITAESLEGNRRLKAIVRAGVGTDNIDKVAATRLGIIVMNTPTGKHNQHGRTCLCSNLGDVAQLGPCLPKLVRGSLGPKTIHGSSAGGKGLGHCRHGTYWSRDREAGTGIRNASDRVRSVLIARARFAELGVELVESVHDMLPRIDYLTVHTPLTPETKDLIGSAEIEMMRPGVRLINAARGGIYNEQALAEGLRSGKLGGVALDVYEQEPCKNSPLFGMPGVLCTPHLGASTTEAQTQVAVEAVNLLISYLNTGEVRHAVNVAAIDPATLASMKGFLNVAYRLGMLPFSMSRRQRNCLPPLLSRRSDPERHEASHCRFLRRLARKERWTNK